MEIRGIWLTTTDSKVLDSRENIAEAIKFLAETGFNVVFPVVWNQGSTNYPSQVMKEKFGIEIKERFRDKVTKTIRDPLQELIEEAQKFDIAVIPWFEYGFMSSYKGNGGKIIQQKKQWAACGLDGNELIVNDYYWLNALDPEVQEFILSLFLEVVNKYGNGIAGIQGDDHLPAFPMEGGYDEKTIKRYKDEFNQQPPPKPPKRRNPSDPKEPLDPLWQDSEWRQQWQQWVIWRADILSNFLHRLYRAVINVNPDLIISMSPNNYPWCYDNYLQDSQAWIDWGLVDLIHPQIYDKELKLYQTNIDKVVSQQFTQQKLPQLIPAILLKKSTYKITPEYLDAAIKTNRCLGLQGEVLFFYEGLRDDKDALANVLKSGVYSQPAGKFDPKEIKKNTFTHRRINNSTEIITSPENILKVEFDGVEAFSEGLAAVKMGYKYGYIDTTGKLVVRMEYDKAEPFSEGVALVKIDEKDVHSGYIDKTGKFMKLLAN
ncbi:family 10 glycosylhydrolase [Calothrix sp. FACHB-156]|nr:family 10 glycosylhydrolase [Calothrix sp. FACHB-156]